MALYLYDASAILNLVKRGVVKAFAKGCTIDLAVYEAVNAIWKECYLLKRMRAEVAYELAELLSKIFSVMDVRTVRGSERGALEVAMKEGVTVYDASYIYIAARDGLTLVTDDRKLIDVARKYASASTTAEVVM